MNNLIKFSIFTPTYNGEKFIKSCIDSVLNQNLTEFEWYIYDDGSTDSTYDVLKKLVLNDRRVHLSRGDNGNSIERMNDFSINKMNKISAFVVKDNLITKLQEALIEAEETENPIVFYQKGI